MNTALKRSRRRSTTAFATTTAVIYFALVSVVIGLVTLVIAADVRRTATSTGSTQMRQLLLAGTIAVQGKLNEAETENQQGAATAANWTINLPSELEGSHLKVELSDAPTIGEVRIAKVTAMLAGHGHESVQEVALKRVGNRWETIAVQLMRN